MPPETSLELHGGRLVAQRLKAHGVTRLFTLSGGHLFAIYDGCRSEGIALVDTRHEQTAAFAAEGWAKATRELGVCALTAGPGVTNGMSAIASAAQNCSPMLVLGGRAPQARWGQGSLQEIDHIEFVRPLTKFAATAETAADISGLIDDAVSAALTPPYGPVFIDFPLDRVSESAAPPEHQPPRPEPWCGEGAGAPAIAQAASIVREAERPAIMAGTGLYWGRGETLLRDLAERLRIPVFLNGLARGCVPADHELFFSRVRSRGLSEADVVLVIGAPLDFRLGFGAVFSPGAKIVVVDAVEPDRPSPRAPTCELYGALPATLAALRDQSAGGDRHEHWIESLRAGETESRESEAPEQADLRAPLHPMRVYAELAEAIGRDAIVIGDGGDFVSYAGRLIESFEPGCWLDPGPYGCLGSGPGYALAAKLARPDREVVLLLGDGAFGFAGMEFDTLARHDVAVIGVIGNNGIWGLEKHPMEFLYGYSVVADLRPETRYDEVVAALGGHGELVRKPGQLLGAFERARASGRPALINVLTDPTVAYPRRSNLG